MRDATLFEPPVCEQKTSVAPTVAEEALEYLP